MGNMLPVGRVCKLFGHEGEISIILYDDFPDDIDLREPMFVVVDSLSVPLFMDKFEPKGRSGAIVRFADIDNEKRAGELLGKELFLPYRDIERVDEFCMEDLVGFTVAAGGREGELTDYYDSDVNPLFGITIDGEERLVPAVEEFIVSIDFEGRRMTMMLPEGLLDI